MDARSETPLVSPTTLETVQEDDITVSHVKDMIHAETQELGIKFEASIEKVCTQFTDELNKMSGKIQHYEKTIDALKQEIDQRFQQEERNHRTRSAHYKKNYMKSIDQTRKELLEYADEDWTHLNEEIARIDERALRTDELVARFTVLVLEMTGEHTPQSYTSITPRSTQSPNAQSPQSPQSPPKAPSPTGGWGVLRWTGTSP